MKTTGSAAWTGGVRDGQGTITSRSGALQAYPYGFSSRFEGKPGSNPEELIGAAHAACFTMALALALDGARLRADDLATVAEVALDKDGAGYAITAVHLSVRARIPGADEATFRRCAEAAKAECPVSKLLKASITLDARLSA